MATARLPRTLALMTILVLAPCLVRSATAQAIRVGAFVSQPTGTVVPHNDSEIAAPTTDMQRVRIDGVGGLDVHAGPGAVVRVQGGRAEGRKGGIPVQPVAPSESHAGYEDRTAVPPYRRTDRITIEFVGN